MQFSKGELKLLLSLALLRPEDGISVHALAMLFERPSHLQGAIEHLTRSGCVLHDTIAGKLRLLERPVITMLGLDAPRVGELFTEERPLDRALEITLRAAPAPIPVENPPRGESTHTAGKAHTPPNRTLETFNRLNVSTIKRSNVAVAAGENCEQLKRRVRSFVGESDFDRHWARADYVWSDPDRCISLAGTLNVVEAGVKSGELKIKRNAGRMLWSYHGFDWAAHCASITK